MRLQTSVEGQRRIQGFEILKLQPYRDGNGWSIGYGHNSLDKPKPVTKAEAVDLFVNDMFNFEQELKRVSHGFTYTQNEWDATMDVLYNVGLTSLIDDCQFFHFMRLGNKEAAANELLKLDKGNPVIKIRRMVDVSIFKHP